MWTDSSWTFGEGESVEDNAWLDYCEETANDLMKLQDELFPEGYASCFYDGSMYGLGEYGFGLISQPSIVWIREDWMLDASLEVPETMDELVNLAEVFMSDYGAEYGMTPIIILTTVLGLGKVMDAGFDQTFNMLNPAVYSTGDIIDTFVYRLGIQQYKYSEATAVGLFKSFVSFILVSTSYYLAGKFASYRIF